MRRSTSQCFDVCLGHGDATLDVTDVIVKVIEDDPVGHVGQPVEHPDHGAAHAVKLLGSPSPFFTLLRLVVGSQPVQLLQHDEGGGAVFVRQVEELR